MHLALAIFTFNFCYGATHSLQINFASLHTSKPFISFEKFEWDIFELLNIKVKKVVLLISVLVMICAFKSLPSRVLLESFTIEKYSYSLFKEKRYLHDDNMDAVYFVVCALNRKEVLCSSFLTLKRNDTIFTKGICKHNQRNIEFKEYYFFQYSYTLDSLLKIFYPMKNGKFLLKEITEYKNGVARKTNY